MERSELLRYLATTLEQLGLSYLVTGATATIAFGEPRFTNDIDVVVKLPGARVGELCRAFPEPDFHVSEDAARQAAVDRTDFNIIHPASGLNIDVIIAKDTPFDRSRFARRIRLRTGPDCEVWFSSPEDAIIKKLAFYQEGGSDKHLRDIAGVLKVMGDRLDRGYVSNWASRLDLGPIWQECLDRLPPE